VKREQLAEILWDWGLFEPLLRARHRLRLPLLTVLTYHRISPPAGIGELDPDTVDADPVVFSEQLDFIQKHFTVVCAQDLAKYPHNRLPPNPLILSFDDGYRDNHDVVLPILRRRGIKATFFVATAYPGAGKLYWWDRVALAIARSRRETVETRGALRLVVHPMGDRRGARATILRLLKRTPGLDPDSFSQEIARAAGAGIGAEEERELAEQTIMSWEHIACLAEAGMDIQSHSHSHRALSTMDDREMERDLLLSREILFSKLRHWPCALAYPTGRSPSLRERQTVARSGFRLAFTNKTGISEPWRFDPYDVPRMATEHDTPPHFFRAVLALPYLSHDRHVHAA
jgi:peptidoglycan/xylan/chitin deacetylase (PgdA/CDA1 family)